MKKVLVAILVVVVIIIGFGFFAYKKASAVTEGEKIASYDNPQKALVIIDIQRDITEKDGKAVLNLKQTDEIIGNVNMLAEKAEVLNLNVIYIQNIFPKGFLIELITGGALAEGSAGAEIDPRVNIINKNIYIKEIMDSFSNREFEKYLINNKINHLYITGLDAEKCIDRTVKGAFNRSYKITIINDAIATSTDEGRKKKIEEFKSLGAEILSTKELLKGV